MPPAQIAMVGASTLLGRELGRALRERRFPSLAPKLLQFPAEPAPNAGPTATRVLIAFDEEAAVAEEFRREALQDLDVLFLAGTAAEARRAWDAVGDARCRVVDLTSGLAEQPGAALAGLEPDADTAAARLIVVAHPAAQAMALLLRRLSAAGAVEIAAATVFEPASERGAAGLEELEQQTLRLLGLQPLPQAVFDAQVAFNLRADLGAEAQPSLAAVRGRIAAETRELLRRDLGTAIPLAVELLQAPLFHACVVSLYVRFRAATAAAVEAALASPWLARRGAEEGYPDVVAATGEDAIQLGPVRPEAGDAGRGFWLFATLDNLRRTAFSAVDAAAEAIARRQ